MQQLPEAVRRPETLSRTGSASNSSRSETATRKSPSTHRENELEAALADLLPRASSEEAQTNLDRRRQIDTVSQPNAIAQPEASQPKRVARRKGIDLLEVLLGEEKQETETDVSDTALATDREQEAKLITTRETAPHPFRSPAEEVVQEPMVVASDEPELAEKDQPEVALESGVAPAVQPKELTTTLQQPREEVIAQKSPEEAVIEQEQPETEIVAPEPAEEVASTPIPAPRDYAKALQESQPLESILEEIPPLEEAPEPELLSEPERVAKPELRSDPKTPSQTWPRSQQVVVEEEPTRMLPAPQPFQAVTPRRQQKETAIDPFDQSAQQAFSPPVKKTVPIRSTAQAPAPRKRISDDGVLHRSQQPVIVSHVEGPRKILVGHEATY
ncbi:MAG: hypothetical protein MI725_02940, partial [Pirellulales bacterium]|nr:hypothetical protein [Pirellulales bacterium]